MTRPEPGLEAIMSERRRLINLAYRLLGSMAEAEDAVQETYARWYAMSRQQQDAIESPGAWLTTVASRICLNVLGSARARRETYVGEWIPEPVPDPAQWFAGRPDGTVDPADRVTLDDSVNMAFLVVLESMTPAQRVAFILHDVFRYSFAEVAEIVGRTPAACRQLASSARRRVQASRTLTAPAPGDASIVRAFKRAWEAKDVDALIGLLDPDATAIADSGGLAPTFLDPIEGGEQIARAWVEIANRAPRAIMFLERTVNGRPGLVAQQDGVTVTVFAIEVAGTRIRHIWAVRNPEKLRSWTTGCRPPAVLRLPSKRLVKIRLLRHPGTRSTGGHMGRLDGKVALITGGARGMGKSHVRHFVAEGARVVFGDVLDDKGEYVAAGLGGESCRYLHHDVTSEADWAAAVALAMSAFGSLDVLVNNAGVLTFAPISEMPLADFRRVLEVNAVGCWLGMKAVIGPMTKAGGGSIVNISSIEGIAGAAGLSAYSASKFAIRGMTKAAAQELGRCGIRVNSVHPGGVLTRMVLEQADSGRDGEAFLGHLPLARFAEPAEISRLVAYLASDESSYSTGSEFVADGGLLSGPGY